VAYGIAILLALWLFLIFRELPGMKYNLPLRAWDFIAPLLGLPSDCGFPSFRPFTFRPEALVRFCGYTLPADPGGDRSARRDPVPRLDPEFDHAETGIHEPGAASGIRHFRMRSSE